jgi:hypothetical protein
MADEPKPLDEIIGEGADRGPSAPPEQPQQPEPLVSEEAGLSAPPEREDRPGLWTFAALKDERSKRQALEAELRQLREEHDRLLRPQQPQQAAPEVPDMFADPAAYHQFVERSVSSRLRDMEANLSFRLMHDRHGEDFEHAYSAMLKLAEAGDPSVVKWVMSTGDPGRALMHWHEQARAQRQGGPLLPSNLSGARNVGQRRGPQWGGPTPLEDIFDRRNSGR